MPCEEYKQALTDAAASGSALSRELQAHLEACLACSAFLANEQQLFAAIDSGMRSTANAELPTSFLPRLRVGVNEQQVPRRSWFPIAAALASAALLSIVVLLIRASGGRSVKPNPQVSSVVRGATPVEAPAVPTPLAATRTQRAWHWNRERSTHVMVAGTVQHAEALVLVPSGQKEAVDALLIALKTGAVSGDVLVADKVQKIAQDGEPPSLAIVPIEIKPLPPVSEESPTDGEKTKR